MQIKALFGSFGNAKHGMARCIHFLNLAIVRANDDRIGVAFEDRFDAGFGARHFLQRTSSRRILPVKSSGHQ